MMSLSWSGQLFGSTGGVMEAAVRTMSAVKNQDPAFNAAAHAGARVWNSSKKRRFVSGDLGDIRIAVVHECANIAKVIEMVRNGTCPYHFVEVMACPGGCVGGGGTTRGVWGRNTAKRQQGIYAIDKVKKIRAS